MDPTHFNYVYQLHKVLYGLKLAPWVWYKPLTEFLLTQRFNCGGTDKTMFIKKEGRDFLFAQVYVDDIIFGGHPSILVANFVDQMKFEFEMSMLEELSFFLGFQIRQCKSRIFLS